MFQPIAWRSKPQVNRLHGWFSSFHAVQHTIRLWPCARARLKPLGMVTEHKMPLSAPVPALPFCCCVEVGLASLRSCQTVAPVDCHAGERWSSDWRTRLFWKARGEIRNLDQNSTPRELSYVLFKELSAKMRTARRFLQPGATGSWFIHFIYYLTINPDVVICQGRGAYILHAVLIKTCGLSRGTGGSPAGVLPVQSRGSNYRQSYKCLASLTVR